MIAFRLNPFYYTDTAPSKIIFNFVGYVFIKEKLNRSRYHLYAYTYTYVYVDAFNTLLWYLRDYDL